MAVIETNTKSSLHLRSNSLPSAPHPTVSQFEENLQRLKGSAATSSASSSSSLCSKLNDMQDLLEGSLRLLDICSEAKDCLLLVLRKNVKKQIQKVLRNLKAMKNEWIGFSSNKDSNTSAMFGFLKEAEAVTLSSLEHLLLFISDSKKQSPWSAISKLMQPQRPVCDSQNEFEKVDADLQSLISHKPSSMTCLQRQLVHPFLIVLVGASFLAALYAVYISKD